MNFSIPHTRKATQFQLWHGLTKLKISRSPRIQKAASCIQLGSLAREKVEGIDPESLDDSQTQRLVLQRVTPLGIGQVLGTTSQMRVQVKKVKDK